MNVRFPEATAFDGYDWSMSKAQALKVLEESAELVEAVKSYVTALECRDYEYRFGKGVDFYKATVIDEAMDVYQTLANLLAGEFTDADIANAYERCLGRNRERGRY